MNLIQTKLSPPSDKTGTVPPATAFIQLERYNAIKLVHSVHATLAALSKVIRGTQLLTTDVQNLASALMNQEVSRWKSPLLSKATHSSPPSVLSVWSTSCFCHADTPELAGQVGWTRGSHALPAGLGDTCCGHTGVGGESREWTTAQ